MFILNFAVGFIAAWLITSLGNMLTINMIHEHWWSLVPMIDYVSAMAITFFPLLFAVLWAFISQAIKEAS